MARASAPASADPSGAAAKGNAAPGDAAPGDAAPGDAAPADAALSQLVEGYWEENLKLRPREFSSDPVVRFEPAAGYDISAQFLADSLDLERRYRDALPPCRGRG